MKYSKAILFSLFVFIITCTQAVNAQQVININADEFVEKVWDFRSSPNSFTYQGDKPCIVDFYADWCGPCRTLGKNLNAIASKYKDQIIIYKINVDNKENADIVSFLQIRSIPFILFANNKQIYNNLGSMSVEQLTEAIDTILLNNSQQ